MLTVRQAAWAIIEQLNQNTPVTADAFQFAAGDPGLFFGEIEDRYYMLSSGEQTLVKVARAVWNRSADATVADVLGLSPNLRDAVFDILRATATA
jgi:hypothetical protein